MRARWSLVILTMLLAGSALSLADDAGVAPPAPEGAGVSTLPAGAPDSWTGHAHEVAVVRVHVDAGNGTTARFADVPGQRDVVRVPDDAWRVDEANRTLWLAPGVQPPARWNLAVLLTGDERDAPSLVLSDASVFTRVHVAGSADPERPVMDVQLAAVPHMVRAEVPPLLRTVDGALEDLRLASALDACHVTSTATEPPTRFPDAFNGEAPAPDEYPIVHARDGVTVATGTFEGGAFDVAWTGPAPACPDLRVHVTFTGLWAKP